MQFSWYNCFCCDCIAVPKISKRLGFEGIKSQKDNKEPNIVVLYASVKACTIDAVEIQWLVWVLHRAEDCTASPPWKNAGVLHSFNVVRSFPSLICRPQNLNTLSHNYCSHHMVGTKGKLFVLVWGCVVSLTTGTSVWATLSPDFLPGLNVVDDITEDDLTYERSG